MIALPPTLALVASNDLPKPGATTPIARILSTFNREQIAGFIEVAIGLLDVADGDPDLEHDDDDACAAGEDNMRLAAYGFGHDDEEREDDGRV